MSSYSAVVFIYKQGRQFIFYSEDEEGRLHRLAGASVLSFFEFKCNCCDESEVTPCLKSGYKSLLDEVVKGRVTLPWAYNIRMLFHIEGELRGKYSLEATDEDEKIKVDEGSIPCEDVRLFTKLKEFIPFVKAKGFESVVACLEYCSPEDEMTDEEMTDFLA